MPFSFISSVVRVLHLLLENKLGRNNMQSYFWHRLEYEEGFSQSFIIDTLKSKKGICFFIKLCFFDSV